MILDIYYLLMITFIMAITNAKPHMNHNLPEHLRNGALLHHYSIVTSYEHSFEDKAEGDCGLLFNIAVKEYKNHPNTFATLTDQYETLENTQFDAKRCKHTVGAYTWVLLIAEDDNAECMIHIPLDIRNYTKNDKDKYPLLLETYAEAAIKEHDSYCVNKYIIGKFDDALHNSNRLNEGLMDSSLNGYQEIMREDEASVLDLPEEKEEAEEEENDGQQQDQYDENEDYEHPQADIPSRDYILHTLRDDKKYERARHARRNAIHESYVDCEKKDLQRIKDLYAAAVIEQQTPGLVLYDENIFNCEVYHGVVSKYRAEIRLNGKIHDAKGFISPIENNMDFTMHSRDEFKASDTQNYYEIL